MRRIADHREFEAPAASRGAHHLGPEVTVSRALERCANSVKSANAGIVQNLEPGRSV